MRLTLTILGHELDISLSPIATDTDTCSLDGGLTYSTPVGFTQQWATPEDIPLPQRTPPWDDEE